MGRREGSTQKKTQECTLTNPQTIHLSETDIVEHYKIDDRGYIHTNKRKWIGSNATVLLGNHEVKDGEIYTDDKVFSCEVIAGGFISSLGRIYAGQEVTVIIHDHPEHIKDDAVRKDLIRQARITRLRAIREGKFDQNEDYTHSKKLSDTEIIEIANELGIDPSSKKFREWIDTIM